MGTPPQGPKASWFLPGHHSATEYRRCGLPGHDERHDHAGKAHPHCVECCRARGRRSANRRYARRRQAALDHYGRECACCGESREVFLAIDHIGGGGNQHRRELGNKDRVASSGQILRWLEQQGYPPGFRTLCHNCNYATAGGRTCPHQAGEQVISNVSE